jgi:hypothetical protein
MKFAVGYQLPEEDEEPLTRIVEEFREHIAEVYFPWPNLPSGRSPMGDVSGAVDWNDLSRLESDLMVFKILGLWKYLKMPRSQIQEIISDIS